MPGRQPRKRRSPSYTALAAALLAVALCPPGARAAGEPFAPGAVALVRGLPPVNVRPPRIAGRLRKGGHLRAMHGAWSHRAQSYRYEWRRCSATRCRPISGAASAGYTLREADVGEALQVLVAAANQAGSSPPAASARTRVVPGAHGPRPAELGAPALSGLAQPGQQLGASQGSWSNAPLVYEYEWLLCNAQGQACSEIPSITGTGYTLTAADLGSTLRVVVIASNAAGESEPALSPPSAVVSSAASKPELVSAPAVVGTPQAGSQLSASPGTWTGAPFSYTYSWRRCNSSGAGCRRIISANGPSYSVASRDVGHTLRVAVTAANAAGASGPALSPPSAVVTAPGGIEAPVNQSPPEIGGLAQLGGALSASPGRWSGQPTSYEYQWQRCDAQGAGCVAISGARATAYSVGEADVGATLRVQVIAANAGGRSAPAISSATGPIAGHAGVSHYEYVFNDGPVSVYDIDNSFKLVETFTLPGTSRGVRGVTVSPAKHMMFVSYGGDGGGNGSGSLLAYDLVAKRVVWSVNLSSGIDSAALSADGSRLYMPGGELAPNGTWYILSTSNGQVVGEIQTPGEGPHDGVMSADGKLLLLGERNYSRLPVYNTQTGKVQEEIGPLVGGVRPNTINGTDSLAFTTATGFDGFQIESLAPPGAVLYTESFATCTGPFSTCSHGISLSPDNRQAYVVDTVHKAVQVWDVHGAGAGIAPVHLATVPVDGLQGEEEGCAYDCARDGWVQHSLDGRYVFVGDSGDVIETATQKVVTQIPNLLNTRELLEIDWAGGVPIASSGRQGIGY